MTTAGGGRCYFGYGSNLRNPALLALPGVRSLGAAALDGYRLRFGRASIRWQAGAADVVPAPGHTVWGELLAVDDEALAWLDGKEGVDRGYYQRASVLLRDGTPAVTYTVVEPAAVEQVPRADYLQHMVDAARALGTPPGWQDFLTGLQDEAAANPEPGTFRRRQHAVAPAGTGARGEQY